tara:strand:+ start:212 stop:481 length:270 start_codon:yes stop_codon:yes gene_type:complete
MPSVITSDDEVTRFVVGYFQKVNQKRELDTEELLTLDYFAGELIDSFGAIEMINSIEDSFDIRFEPTDFENPDFKIVEGLIGIIQTKRA